MATKYKQEVGAGKPVTHRLNLRGTIIAGVSTAFASAGIYFLRRSEKWSADRHDVLKGSARRERLGGFEVRDDFLDIEDAEEVDGLPSGIYTKESLPTLSQETKAYLVALKVRAEALYVPGD